MKKTSFLILLVLFTAASLIGSASHAYFSSAAIGGSPAAVAPQLHSVQLLFKAQPVDEVVGGGKIKKYVLQVTGAGFLPGSSALLNAISAFPVNVGLAPVQETSTAFVSDTTLDVRFLPDSAPTAGILSIRIVNPDGSESNRLSVDVISKPSKLTISSISPQTGPVGTQITLTGTGFMPTAPDSVNALRVISVGVKEAVPFNFFEGFYVDAADGGTITFTLPNRVIKPICPGSPIACDPIAIPAITAGQYRISVINPNGMSNSIVFDVTSK